MKRSKGKFLSMLVVFSLVIQSMIIFNPVFASEASQIKIDIGSKQVRVGDSSDVSIALDKDYGSESIVLKQICHDVFQETTLYYNEVSNRYEGEINYQVEPEYKNIWSIKEIIVGDTILDEAYLQSKGVNLDDYDVYLSYNQMVYSERKKVRSGISTVDLSPYSEYVVVLDPGHGGKPGSGYNWGGTTAVNDTLWEKDYNLETSLATAKYLRDLGVNVIMTRDEDVFLELGERSSFINSINPDLALSIHYNSFTESYTGTRTYYKYEQRDGGIGKKLAQNVASFITSEFNLKNEGAMTYIEKEADGSIINYLHMIREPIGNAALVECCYLSNASDQKKVNTKEKREKMGIQIGKAIEKTLDYMIANNIGSNSKIPTVNNLEAEVNKDGSVKLSWDKVEGCDGYQVFRSDDVEGLYKLVKTTDSTECTLKNLEKGRQYFYKVNTYKTSNGLSYYGKFSNTAPVYITKPGKIVKDIAIKSEMDATSADIGSLNKDEMVEVVYLDENWAKILYNDSYGYIPREAITFVLQDVKYLGITKSSVNVRSGPTTSYNKVGSLEANVEVQIVEIDKATGWYKIIYKDDCLYVSNEYIELKNAPVVNPETGMGITTGNVNMRKGPSTAYEKIDYILEGTKVEILGVASTGWYKVSYNGKEGYVSNSYIKKVDTEEPEVPVVPEEPEVPVTPEEPPVQKVYGVTTGNVNMRKGPSTAYEKIDYIVKGTKVEILDVASTGWYKVSYNGKEGYVSNLYVNKEADGSETPVQKVYGVTTGNVNMRKGPSTSYAKIDYIAKGTRVEILDVASTGWYKVSYNGKVGYVSNSYINKEGSGEEKPPVQKVYGVTTSNVNMRKGPSTSYAKIDYIVKGTKVEILGVASTGWYKVSYNGKTGYVSNSYMKKL